MVYKTVFLDRRKHAGNQSVINNLGSHSNYPQCIIVVDYVKGQICQEMLIA